MKLLYDETYSGEGRSSRNLWYGELALSEQGEYGSLLSFPAVLEKELLEVVQDTQREVGPACETNWYFYDAQSNADALNEQSRGSLMIREQDGVFIVHINMSDHNFAVNLGPVLAFQDKLQTVLNTKNKG